MVKKRKEGIKKSAKPIKTFKRKEFKKAHHKLRRARNNFFKKSAIVILVIILFVLLAYLLFFILEKIPGKKDEGGLRGKLANLGFSRSDFDLAGANIIKEDCSDENLKEIWDFMFKESFNGRIVSDKTAEEICQVALLYNTEGNEVSFLFLYYNESEDSIGLNGYAYTEHGIYTDEFADVLKNVTPFNIPSFYEDLLTNKAHDFINGTRSVVIENEVQASLTYDAIFNVLAGEWWLYGSGDDRYYMFNESVTDDSSFKLGVIFPDYLCDFFYYYESIAKKVNLTKIVDIPDLNIYSKSTTFMHKINNYFDYLGSDGRLDLTYKVSKPGITDVGLYYNDQDGGIYLDFDIPQDLGGVFSMNITLTHPDWDGAVVSNNFQVIIVNCTETDNGVNASLRGVVNNNTDTKTDVCINENSVMEYYCNSSDAIIENYSIACDTNYSCSDGACFYNVTEETNQPPVFLSDCESIEWEINENYILDMESCFSDAEEDNLTYNSGNLTGSISISRNESELTLTPTTDWTGEGLFYLYANDSGNKTEGIVNFIVSNTTIIVEGCEERGYSCINASLCIETLDFDCDTGVCCNRTITVNTASSPEIRNPNPSSENINSTEGNNLTFSITSVNWDRIEWRLEGVLQEENTESYELEDLEEGEYEVKVIVRNGEKSVERKWNLSVEKKEKPSNNSWIFWIIILFVIIGVVLVILFIVFKFISKDQLKPEKPNAFGGSVNDRIQIKTGAKETSLQEQFRQKLKSDLKPTQQSYAFQNK